MASHGTAFQVTPPSCVFCTFVRERTRDAQKIYEDDDVLVILDDFPIAQGHTLVIVKHHREDFSALTSDEASHLGKVCVRVTKALQACGIPKVYVATLGEEIQHVHCHLVPRYGEDKKGFVHFLTPRKPLVDGPTFSAKVRQALARLPP